MAEYIGKVGVGSYSTGDTPPVSLDDTGAVRTAGSVSVTVTPPTVPSVLVGVDTAPNYSYSTAPIALYSAALFNSDSVTWYVQLSNSGDVSPITPAPTLTLGVPANGGNNYTPPANIPFSVGLVVFASQNAAGDDSIFPSGGKVTVNLQLG